MNSNFLFLWILFFKFRFVVYFLFVGFSPKEREKDGGRFNGCGGGEGLEASESN